MFTEHEKNSDAVAVSVTKTSFMTDRWCGGSGGVMVVAVIAMVILCRVGNEKLLSMNSPLK